MHDPLTTLWYIEQDHMQSEIDKELYLVALAAHKDEIERYEHATDMEGYDEWIAQKVEDGALALARKGVPHAA